MLSRRDVMNAWHSSEAVSSKVCDTVVSLSRFSWCPMYHVYKLTYFHLQISKDNQPQATNTTSDHCRGSLFTVYSTSVENKVGTEG